MDFRSIGRTKAFIIISTEPDLLFFVTTKN